MKFTKKLIAAMSLVMMSAASSAATIPVDLTSWVAEGDGVWTLGTANESVVQSINGDQTVFFDPTSNDIGSLFSATISVAAQPYDDDYIGFVFGYQAGELASSTSEYYVMDWKRVTQNYQGNVADRGLAFSTVSGLASFGDLWAHSGAVTEVKRAENLGTTGWKPNTQYSFDIVYTSSLIEIFVNNSLELSVTAADAGLSSFGDGSIGFYNLSQSGVTYSGLTTQEANLTEVPLPNTIALFGLSLIAVSLRKRLRKQH